MLFLERRNGAGTGFVPNWNRRRAAGEPISREIGLDADVT
jgi:hypothetical protein